MGQPDVDFTLETVQYKFASIIGELCGKPSVLSRFAIWLDLRLSEYKLKGSISLDCSGQKPDPHWLNGLKTEDENKEAADLFEDMPCSPEASSIGKDSPAHSDSTNQDGDDVDYVILKQESAGYDSDASNGNQSDSGLKFRNSAGANKRKRLSEIKFSPKPLKLSRKSCSTPKSLPPILQDSQFDQRSENIQQETAEIPNPIKTEVSDNDSNIPQSKRDNSILYPNQGAGNSTELQDEESFVVNSPTYASEADVQDFNIQSQVQQSDTNAEAEIDPEGELDTDGGEAAEQELDPPLMLHSQLYDVPSYDVHSYDDLMNSLPPAPTGGRFKNPKIDKLVKEYGCARNTVSNVSSSVTCFQRWMSTTGRTEFNYDCTRELYDIPPKELDLILVNFFRSVKKPNGDEYNPGSLRAMRTSIARYLKENLYPNRISIDKVFHRSQQAFKRRLYGLEVPAVHLLPEPPELPAVHHITAPIITPIHLQSSFDNTEELASVPDWKIS